MATWTLAPMSLGGEKHVGSSCLRVNRGVNMGKRWVNRWVNIGFIWVKLGSFMVFIVWLLSRSSFGLISGEISVNPAWAAPESRDST